MEASPDKLSESICPRCGKAFHCSKSGKCWCYEVYLPVSLLEAIDEVYDRCLCPMCLTELLKKHHKEPEPRYNRKDFILQRKKEPGRID